MKSYTGGVKRVDRSEWYVTFNNGSTNATLNISILDDTNCTKADEFRLCINPTSLANYSDILNANTDIANHSALVIIMDDDCISKYH